MLSMPKTRETEKRTEKKVFEKRKMKTKHTIPNVAIAGELGWQRETGGVWEGQRWPFLPDLSEQKC